MQYFKQFLSSNDCSEDLDISVHCDVKIFDWLMKYVRDKQGPILENKNVISILISSEFLQMHGLVSECIQYIRDKLQEVVRFPIDLACLNSGIISRLDKQVSLQ